MSEKEVPLKETIKSFHFTDETDIIDLSCSSSDSLCSESDQHVCNEGCLNIKIKEVLHPSYGMHVWASAPVLSKFIWYNRSKLKEKTVLELGSGTGLVSVVAAKCKAHVILTDSKKYECTFQTALENLQLNGISKEAFEIKEMTWGYFSANLVQSPPIDIILGSDVFYSPKDFEDIIVTVSFLLKKNQSAEFWCTYEHRCTDWNIDNYLEKWNLNCEEISLSDFGADGFNVAGCDLPGLKTISLLIFRYSK
ncbi:hypothetical protein JTE90_003880 [Oedothorax gibbosus]|uniref:Methyltransferase-like protein 23 n=1 Tax=Oedothorax gibbosus TaxID=931172 RepID=A0AAV6UIB2_9ARAC|nr:hypothetical protein JTE90_003880 [Oedothorax gibbosus]